jgi:hypothetical protein
MALWLQNLIVIGVVLLSATVVLWQALAALRGGKSKLAGCGGCKGCASHAAPTKPPTAPQRKVFLPVEFVGRPRK